MLEDAWDAAPEGALTLREQLRAYERAAGSVVSGGSLASISKNTSSHSYAFGNGNITATEVANTWRELIDLFDLLLASFTEAAIEATDATIYPEMMRRLVPLNSFTKDFTEVTA